MAKKSRKANADTLVNLYTKDRRELTKSERRKIQNEKKNQMTKKELEEANKQLRGPVMLGFKAGVHKSAKDYNRQANKRIPLD